MSENGSAHAPRVSNKSLQRILASPLNWKTCTMIRVERAEDLSKSSAVIDHARQLDRHCHHRPVRRPYSEVQMFGRSPGYEERYRCAYAGSQCNETAAEERQTAPAQRNTARLMQLLCPVSHRTIA